MRTNEKRIKKTPADYPQMIFRINQEDKSRLSKQIERVLKLANRDANEKGLMKFRKNDVIIDALFLGLQTLEKKFGTYSKK